MKLSRSTLYTGLRTRRRGVRIVLTLLAFVIVPACSSDDPTQVQIVPGNVAMSQAALNLIVGGSSDLSVTVTDTNGAAIASPTVSWTSNNSSVATVSGSGTSATVTGVGPGSATITATSGSVNATSNVTVVPAEGFAGLVQPILTQNCAVSGCHTGTGAAAGLDMTAGAAHGNIVLVASGQLPSMSLIEPGDPANSYLMHKVQGTHLDVGGSGLQMPRNRTPLVQAVIDDLIDWVNDGAPNN